jgi:glycosyltransferase involved in cell wall biosynthesis
MSGQEAKRRRVKVVSEVAVEELQSQGKPGAKAPVGSGRRTLVYVCVTSAMAGAEHNMIRLIRKLNPEAWRVIVVAPEEGELPEACRFHGIEVRVVQRPRVLSSSIRLSTKWRVPNPFACAWDVGVIFRGARKLGRVLAELQPDLVVTKGLFAHLYGALAARSAGVPCLWHVEDWVSERWWGLFRRCFARLARRLPTRIVGCADTIARQMPEDIRHKVGVIYNGIDTQGFRPGVDGTAARRELTIPEDALVIGHVGRMTPWKGQRYLLEAFARVAADFPAARLLFIGSALFEGDAFQRSLEKRTSTLGLQDRVNFLGYRRDVRPLLAAMDVFAIPSIEKETGPLSLLEAMAAGLPVVGFDIPGVRMFAAEDRHGLLVPVEDVAALSRTLARVLGDGDLRCRLAKGARERVEEAFSFDRHAAQFEQLFLDVIGQNERDT